MLILTLGSLVGCHTAETTDRPAPAPAKASPPAATASPAPAPSSTGRAAVLPENSFASSNLTASAAVEFKKLLASDDAAHAEVDQWILENKEFEKSGGGVPRTEMRQNVLRRLAPVHQAYEDFIQRHPDFEPVRVAFASFLDELGDEDGERDQLEVARQLDPKDSAVWNNLANYYGHNGPTTNAFAYYEKAIALTPNEPVYLQNYATTVYLFRRDAMEFFNLPEAQIFDKALDLYTRALKLDPTNFPLATDLAESYYGIRPLRTNDALQSWTNALTLAHDDVEREAVYTHLARIKLSIGQYDEARAHLNAVTNGMYDALKQRLLRNLNEKEAKAKTNGLTDADEPGWMRMRGSLDEEVKAQHLPTNSPSTP